MKKGYSLIVIGVITLIFGLIFDLQGQSMIGPETSFMYANPNWIAYGIGIMIAGIGVVVIGITLKVLRK